MKKNFVLLTICVIVEYTRSATIINSFVNEKNSIGEECGILSPDLIAEIQSYKPVVDKIVAAAVNGPHSGATWDRYVHDRRDNRI